MIKKIVITYYDGSFGPFYKHWEEKMTITPEKVRFVRKHYSKCIETYDIDESYKQVEDVWSYKINIWSEYEFRYYNPIFETILNEVRGYDPSLDYSMICDAGDVGITVYDEYGIEYSFHNLLSLPQEETKELFKCFKKFIPNNVLKPFFVKEFK